MESIIFEEYLKDSPLLLLGISAILSTFVVSGLVEIFDQVSCLLYKNCSSSPSNI